MGEFFRGAFSALPAIASSPLAFVGYIVVVLVWALVAWKVRRSKQLLINLQKFPAKDRLEAFKVDAGIAHLSSGLSPEQWMRSRIQLYYLLGFSVIFLCLVIIFVVAASSQTPGTIYVSAGILIISLIVILASAYRIGRSGGGSVSVDITPYVEPGHDLRE